MQPVITIVLGIRGGLADAKAGNPPYLLGLVLKAGRRSELLQSGGAAIRTFTSALNHGEILARPCNRKDGNHRHKHDNPASRGSQLGTNKIQFCSGVSFAKASCPFGDIFSRRDSLYALIEVTKYASLRFSEQK
jgi:hypothetical protein